MSATSSGPVAVLERLLDAMNTHDLDAMVSCYADDYLNETPAHPRRGFRGNEQIRTNWTQIFAGVPDLHADVPGYAVDGDRLWTEWDIAGTRRDGTEFLMRGVAIFGISDGAFASCRFYLEPVETSSGDTNVHAARVTGAEAAS